MTVIKKIQDNSGSQFFPVTHERAVKDDNGTTLETKLQDINVAIDTTIPNHFTQVDSSIEQLLAANTELRITVNNLVGISNDSFMGIFQTVNDLPTMTSPGWALVGINLASLLLYTYTNITNAWTKYNDDTYDFTDYSGLVSQLAQIGSNLSDLTQRSNKFLRLAVMIDSTNGILSIGGKRYKLIPTTDTPTWDLDYNDFVTKSTTDNEEWEYVLTDSENRILYGINTNGDITDNSSIVEGATVGGFDVIAIINNYAATYNYD